MTQRDLIGSVQTLKGKKMISREDMLRTIKDHSFKSGLLEPTTDVMTFTNIDMLVGMLYDSIGLCGECKHTLKKVYQYNTFCSKISMMVEKDFFCSDFEAKDENLC